MNKGILLLLFLSIVHNKGYQVRVSENEPPRINIVTGGAGFTGGGVTIWYLAACLIKAGFRVRYFVQHAATGRLPNADIARFEALSEELHDIGNLMEFDSGERPVPCNRRDLWMATICLSWDRVYAAQSQLQNPRPLYLVQDDERWLSIETAMRSYNKGHYAIFNGPPLRDWFADHKLGVFSNGTEYGENYSYTATAALSPRVPVTSTLLAMRRAPFNKKRLAVYYRNHARRNEPELILAILSQLVLRGIVSTDEWDLVGISDHGPLDICTLANGSACLRIPAMLGSKEYDAFLGGCDVAISLCTSGGASWPIIDFATHGAVVITNGASMSHQEFFESLAPTVLVTPNVTLDALIALTARGINISNKLSLEERATAARSAASRFPTKFCSQPCFGDIFIRKVSEWMNVTVVPRRSKQISMAVLVLWLNKQRYPTVALLWSLFFVTMLVSYRLMKQARRSRIKLF